MKRVPIALLLLLTTGFIGFGDRIFPRPIGQYSTSIRNTIDQAMVSAFPQWSPKTNPNRRTEDAIRSTEGK